MSTIVECSYIITTPTLLENAGVNISTKRRSIDGSYIVSDLNCLSVEQLNNTFKPECQIESMDDIKNLTIEEVEAMFIDGFNLYSSEDTYAIMQTPEWSDGGC